MRRLTAVSHLLAVGCALVALCVWYDRRASTPNAMVGPAAYGRIKAGMRLSEAEGIVGLPAGEYTDEEHRALAAVRGRACVAEEMADGAPLPPGGAARTVTWAANDHFIAVWVDGEGVIWSKELWSLAAPPRRGPLDKLRAWLRSRAWPAW
jgi:hypothetical protein